MVDFNTFNDTDSPENTNIADGNNPTIKAKVAPDDDGANRLYVDADLKATDLVPAITNKFRIRLNNTDTTLPNTNAWVTLFTRNGSGLFFGFQASFNSEKINIRLTLDGGEVFDLNLEDIRDFQFNDTSTTRVQMGGFLTTIANTLDFSSKFAIPYETSVSVEARSVDGVAHQNNRWVTFGTEDT